MCIRDRSGGLPTFISPWIDGKKAVMAASGQLSKSDAVSVDEHEKEWSEIFDGIKGVVDACAFQDGHIDYDELDAFFEVNKRMADKYGIECWTNAETFDRDMPIKFFPIKFDKLRLKLEAAKRAVSYTHLDVYKRQPTYAEIEKAMQKAQILLSDKIGKIEQTE